jgi:hypothetical protein
VALLRAAQKQARPNLLDAHANAKIAQIPLLG